MNKIYVLDDIDLDKTHQTIRLKKVYNITLLALFPTVIEVLIHDYVNDIIEAKITLRRLSEDYNVEIKNQYINCIPISFSFYYDILGYTVGNADMNNIAEIILNTYRIYPYTEIINKYMSLFYKSKLFIDNTYVHELHYTGIYNLTIYDNNILTYSDSYCDDDLKPILKIKINNHKLFKNMIVIIKCINDKFIKKYKKN